MSKKTFRPRNEFRYNFSKKHKNYVFGENEDKFYSLGITHEAYTFGRRNMPLKVNPQYGKKEKAYIRNGVIIDKKRSYGRPLRGYRFGVEDYRNVKSKIRKYKRKIKNSK